MTSDKRPLNELIDEMLKEQTIIVETTLSD
jgi:hypothetical protein